MFRGRLMIRSRASALAFTTAFVGASVLSGFVAMPLAHATELDDIAAVVKGNRPATCAPLVYNGALEGAAQAYARSENPVDGQPGGYNGKTLAFLGSGDPQKAAINSAFSRGAGGLVTNCDFTEFGVGFIRYEDGQPLGAGNRRGDDATIDVVTIVFGSPPKAAAPPVVEAPVVEAPKPAKVPCPAGSPVAEVDAGQVCPPVVVPDVTNAISANFATGLLSVKVTVSNSSDLSAKCTYDATPFDVHRDFTIAPKGEKVLNFSGVNSGTDYQVKIVCNDASGKQSVPIGTVDDTVRF